MTHQRSSSVLLPWMPRSCNPCLVTRKLPGSLSDATPRPVGPLCACVRCACSLLSKTQVAMVACMPPSLSFFHLLHCPLLCTPLCIATSSGSAFLLSVGPSWRAFSIVPILGAVPAASTGWPPLSLLRPRRAPQLVSLCHFDSSCFQLASCFLKHFEWMRKNMSLEDHTLASHHNEDSHITTKNQETKQSVNCVQSVARIIARSHCFLFPSVRGSSCLLVSLSHVLLVRSFAPTVLEKLVRVKPLPLLLKLLLTSMIFILPSSVSVRRFLILYRTFSCVRFSKAYLICTFFTPPLWDRRRPVYMCHVPSQHFNFQLFP